MRKLVVLLFFPLSVFGQNFNAEAPLPVIDKNGFYNIPLPPHVTAWLESDFSNIRIVDENGNEVPYVIQKEQPTFTNVEFIEYEIEKTEKKNCCTTIIIINKQKKQLNNIILEVKNAEVLKRATLRGSDDRQSWYALKDDFRLGNFSDDRRTSQLSILDFPLSDYTYYEIVINDSAAAPLNIVRAGYYNTNKDYGVYVEVPKKTFLLKDTVIGRRSDVTVRFDTTQFIDKIEFDVVGPVFYHRDASLFMTRYNDLKKLKWISFPVVDFKITSTHSVTANFSLKVDEFLLAVENNNNPPLKFVGVRAWQLRRSLTAWLESGHNYKVALGDSLQVPIYDLEFFRDSIPDRPPVLQLGELKKFTRSVEATSPTYFTNRNIIWLAIALVVVVLGVMSVRMIRENTNG